MNNKKDDTWKNAIIEVCRIFIMTTFISMLFGYFATLGALISIGSFL